MNTLTLDTFMELIQHARRYDGYIAGLCPFHDDRKPSLMVYEDDYFKCLGCGREGRHVTLYDALRSPTRAKILRPGRTRWRSPRLPTDLGEISDLVWRAHQRLVEKPSTQWYLEKRGVEGRIEPCALGWIDGWYTIPIFSSRHQVRGVILRAGEHVEKVTDERFVQPEGQRAMLYVPDWHILEGAKALAIVFGMFDALALSDIRIPVCTTTGGKSEFRPEWLDFWRGPIVIIPDEGEFSDASRLAGELGWRAKILRLPYPDDIKDPCGYLETGRRGELMRLLHPAFQ